LIRMPQTVALNVALVLPNWNKSESHFIINIKKLFVGFPSNCNIIIIKCKEIVDIFQKNNKIVYTGVKSFVVELFTLEKMLRIYT
jgi:UPF0288 family protein (methanogenesis marker protein 3)